MMTPVNNELERRKKVRTGGSIPGSSKGLLSLPQYPNQPASYPMGSRGKAIEM